MIILHSKQVYIKIQFFMIIEIKTNEKKLFKIIIIIGNYIKIYFNQFNIIIHNLIIKI